MLDNRVTILALLGLAVSLLVTVTLIIALVQAAQTRDDLAAQREALVTACADRGNPLREQVNTNGAIQRRSLKTAAKAREELAKVSPPDQAKIQSNSAAQFRHQAAQIKPLPLPNCETAYPKP